MGFESLPYVPLISVFKLLPASDLYNCSLVSSYWSSVASSHSLWMYHCEKDHLFEEDDVRCSCYWYMVLSRSIFRPCSLRDHYHKYSLAKTNLKNCTFDIDCIPVRPNLLTTSSDGKILVISSGTLTIWDINYPAEKIFYCKCKRSNCVVKAEIIDNILFLLYSDVTLTPEHIYVRTHTLKAYLGIPAAVVNSQNGLYTRSSTEVFSSKEIYLSLLHSKIIDPWPTSWYISLPSLVYNCQSTNSLQILYAYTGKQARRVKHPIEFQFTLGHLDETSLYYAISTSQMNQQHTVCSLNLNPCKRLWRIQLPLDPKIQLQAIDVLERRYLAITTNKRMFILDKNAGDLITILNSQLSSITTIVPMTVPKECESLLNCLRNVKERSTEQVFGKCLDYVVSPFGGFICCNGNNEFTYICDRYSKDCAQTDLTGRINKPFNNLRTYAKHVSRKTLVVTSDMDTAAYVFRFI